MNINGSVALVTGANRGLGLAFVQGLLAAGASKVYAGARDPQNIGIPGVQPIKLDITNPYAVAEAEKICGDVNLLINNAGILQPAPLVSESSIDVARAQMETNFFGTLAMCSAFAPILQKNDGGALVNMLSVLSWLNLPMIGGYCASKSAAWALTNGIRNELRKQGTLVVGVHAAFIDTDMARNVQAPKVKPEDVVLQTLKAIEAGQEEVLADDTTKKVKSGLSAEQAVYLNEVKQ
jgi:NAD(P)-dependent dehydrogenase (short-subunit alcohol dehydrogenase family)